MATMPWAERHGGTQLLKKALCIMGFGLLLGNDLGRTGNWAIGRTLGVKNEEIARDAQRIRPFQPDPAPLLAPAARRSGAADAGDALARQGVGPDRARNAPGLPDRQDG